jgi:uncharacterized cupin superfamily protein
MTDPILVADVQQRTEGQSPIAASGRSFDVHEWSGSGPDYLHVLEGTLTFRFRDKQVEAQAGTTVFVPAGVPHAYFESQGPTRYLIILTPRLRDLISALHEASREQHDEIMRRFESEILE